VGDKLTPTFGDTHPIPLHEWATCVVQRAMLCRVPIQRIDVNKVAQRFAHLLAVTHPERMCVHLPVVWGKRRMELIKSAGGMSPQRVG
jgi:hypothetical protein